MVTSGPWTLPHTTLHWDKWAHGDTSDTGHCSCCSDVIGHHLTSGTACSLEKIDKPQRISDIMVEK